VSSSTRKKKVCVAYLEFSESKMLAEACTRSIDEGDEMAVSLKIFGRSWDPLATVQPSFRLKLPGIFSPKRLHPIDHEDRNRCLLPRQNDDLICDLTIRECDGCAEWDDVVPDWLCIPTRIVRKMWIISPYERSLTSRIVSGTDG
jgi:hypothetical protein